MRLIATIPDERKGLAFSLLLRKEGIQHQIEVSTNTDWGSSNYGTSSCQIWVTDEDQVPQATQLYEEFTSHPEAYLFKNIDQPSAVSQAPEEPPINDHASMAPPLPGEEHAEVPSAWSRQPMGPITRFILLTCCFIFFATQLFTPAVEIPPGFPSTPLFSSPVEKKMLYDYPKTYELIDQLISLYGYEALQEPQNLPKEGLYLVNQINKTPYWQGFYSYIKREEKGEPNPEKGLDAPMFEKIRQGEVWRLFSPCLFHGDLFHLFFNMLWLIVLGKQLEQRLRAGRYILFILLVGVFSNTAQYLVGGPNFIGFSGILIGMLAFIWVRQQRAPWESYQIDRATIIFMMLFVIGMAILQLLSFFLETSLDITVSPGIANTAHLAGGIGGFLLGYLNFFRWKGSPAR